MAHMHAQCDMRLPAVPAEVTLTRQHPDQEPDGQQVVRPGTTRSRFLPGSRKRCARCACGPGLCVGISRSRINPVIW
jgi:hypothetical protein